ncbi:hypothetical protein Tsubulata_001588 [Turnera subulata]|uniref:Uncharacterized protein n=1 Tax=Turnera subulata TaxID=218843 RepID=A0A9Q0F1U9_9ROSI|nr:hypothetical protein Tsubulata_001588 [Turnera subulata]
MLRLGTMTATTASCNITSLNIRSSQGCQRPGSKRSCVLPASKFNHKCQSLGIHHRFPLLITSLGSRNVKMNMTAYSGVDPGVPLPSDPSPGSWKFWILGMVITVLLPFCRNGWGPLLRLRDKVERAVETAETVAEIVETVAEKVDEMAEEVADHLPEGGRLKKLATSVEKLAEETAKGAHRAEELIDKVLPSTLL